MQYMFSLALHPIPLRYFKNTLAALPQIVGEFVYASTSMCHFEIAFITLGLFEFSLLGIYCS